MKKIKLVAFLAILLGLASGFLPAQDQEQLRFAQEVVVRYWLVPVYAMNKDGSPAVGLTAEDFEVLVNGRKVGVFDLHRKEFQAVAARPEAPAGESAAPAPFQKKMILLVFDSAFSSYNLMEKAKKVAETMMAQEDQAAQFVALSIEPFAGLKSICGPTRDRELVARSIKTYISGKKMDYLRTSALDSTGIRDVYPKDSKYADRNPDASALRGKFISSYERLDIREKRRIAAVYTQSLMSLNLILGYFKDNTKVVYLFSCGIPAGAMEWKSEYNADPNSDPDPMYVNIFPDSFNIDALKKIGKVFNQNGSLLFLINPSGNRVSFTGQNSGEQSLRLLADESGGRYYEGPEKDISREIAGMESAYHEISFPDDKAYEGLDIDFDIRARKPELTVYTVKRISRGKDYLQMGRLEKQVLVLNLLDDGPFAQTKLKAVDSGSKSTREGDHAFFEMTLPAELAGSSWDVFRVWRDEETGRVLMEEDRLPTSGYEVRLAMAWREGQSHELVLVHGQTGTALVSKL